MSLSAVKGRGRGSERVSRRTLAQSSDASMDSPADDREDSVRGVWRLPLAALTASAGDFAEVRPNAGVERVEKGQRGEVLFDLLDLARTGDHR
jgi:hypothetical protein